MVLFLLVIAVIWGIDALGVASTKSVFILVFGSVLIQTISWLFTRTTDNAIALNLEPPERETRAADVKGHFDPGARTAQPAAPIGRPPFVPIRKNLFAWHELREAHLTHEPPPLRVRRPDCPEGVERAVLRGLSKRRADRFDTAGDFAAAFEAGSDSEPAST